MTLWRRLLKLLAQIPVAFALPLQLTLPLALFLQLSQPFLTRIGLVPPKHFFRPIPKATIE